MLANETTIAAMAERRYDGCISRGCGGGDEMCGGRMDRRVARGREIRGEGIIINRNKQSGRAEAGRKEEV